MAHDQLSPSKAHRWTMCPGSVREEAAYPDEPSGPAAIDGTHSHTLLEHCIKGGLGDPTAMVGVTLKDHEGTFVVDRDRAARVKVAIEYIKKRVDELGEGTQVISERRVSPEWLTGQTNMSGTADVQIIGNGVYEVVDYKDGMAHVPVKGNKQLALYAIGGLSGLKLPINGNYPYHTVRATVIQPKLSLKGLPPIDSIDTPTKDILALASWFTSAALATQAPDAPLVSGDHCKYCKHKACSQRANDVMKGIGVMFQPVEQQSAPEFEIVAKQVANKDPAVMDDKELAELVEAAPLMRQMIEAVETEAQRRLEQGKTIPGLKLVNGRGSNVWTLSEDQMVEKLTRMGIPKSEVYVTKLVSPAQVKKLQWEATKGGEKVTKSLSDRQLKTIETEYVAKVAGKPTLALESDPRPAVVTNAAPMFSAVQPEPAVELPDWLTVKA